MKLGQSMQVLQLYNYSTEISGVKYTYSLFTGYIAINILHNFMSKYWHSPCMHGECQNNFMLVYAVVYRHSIAACSLMFCHNDVHDYHLKFMIVLNAQ